jgi:UDP-N-acetylglucosamine--N-acetylmuramyl-(pentapeptide) pyrophosphoryl-undecaprenol N-acetylglucosamine transferase
MKKVLIMAGGTGGHVFPALAVAKVMQSRGVTVEWIGTERGIESRLVPESGLTLHLINVAGLRGNGLLGWLLAPYKVCKATYEALQVVRKGEYDLVLGLGGFAAGPGGLAAWLTSKPLVIHEQNAIPGLTNKVLAKLASRVLTGFPNVFSNLRQATWVGNPVRAEIERLKDPAERINLSSERLHVLVLGGSLGAKTLNDTLPLAIRSMKASERPLVRHQCGQRHLEACRENYEQVGIEADVTDFIADMAEAYSWADLVVCRAGALTVAELASAGVPSILVPYPHAVDDHQTQNASVLCEVGAAEIIQDSELTPALLTEKISGYQQDRFKLLNMAMAANKVAKRNVAAHITDICQEVANG